MQHRLVVALAPNTYFGCKVVNFVHQIGYEYTQVETRAALLETLRSRTPALVCVDLTLDPGNLLEITGQAAEARLIAYGPPGDTTAHRAARAAGFHEVIPNIQFHREVPRILRRNLPAETLPEVQPPPQRSGEAKGWRRFVPRP
ncbi:MAG: hypothetical protein M3506_09585, partial [Chloroflexota bacterium]|nr:hypothetical protein [Chloroflexota bacterium]